MCKGLKVDTKSIEYICSKWDYIIASISYATRNGKVTNETVYVDRYNAESDVSKIIKGNKLTNMELGTVELHPLDTGMKGEPSSLQLVESLSDGRVGRVMIFKPTLVGDIWVYDLVEEHNVLADKAK
ncbi:MAG: hypothetical protein ACRCZ0_11160 [Cetobacterium sp.]